MNVLEVLEKKFTSGNDVPVSRASITREEYEAIVQILTNKNTLSWRHALPKNNTVMYENGTEVLKTDTDLSDALDAFAKKYQVPRDGVWFNVKKHGNTLTYSANGIVIFVKKVDK